VRADGALSSDGKHVTFDLSGLVTGQDLSFVVAPSPIAAAPPAPLPAPPAPSPPTFDITFEKPSAGALHVSAAPVAAADTSAPPDAAATSAPSPVSDFSTPAASFAPALPSGLSTPPPAVSTGVSSGRVASPSVAFSNRPRLLVPAASKRSFADSAAIAIMLGIVILWLARDSGAGGVRRPRLSLYDAPKPAEAMAVARTGTAPPLR
jgi:hypothetical protein